MIDESEHRRNWYANRNYIIAGKSELSAKEIMNFLFFEFDEQYKDKYRKMVKIICSESVRNNAVCCYMRNSIELSIKYIQTTLNDLQKSGKIANCDTSKLARVLYSIAYAFRLYRYAIYESKSQGNRYVFTFGICVGNGG